MAEYFSAALVFLLSAFSVASLICLPQPRTSVRGWRVLKPGPLHWTGVGLGAGLTCLFSYVWMFVGSSRPDAERQMTILFWLIVAFGSLSIIVGWEMRSILKSAVRQRATTISFIHRGEPQTRAFEDVENMRSTPLGMTRIDFQDGAILKIDPYAMGASQLLDELAAHLEARRNAPL